MTLSESEKEPWPGHDEAMKNLQKWADEIPTVDIPGPAKGSENHIFLGCEKYQASLDAIYEGLGVPKEHA